MNKERLTILANQLDVIPADEHFNMSGWHYETTDCGTVACAVGWGCKNLELNEMGLSLRRSDPFSKAYRPYFDGKSGWSAVEKFFDLTPNEATYLFEEEHYNECYSVTPAVVAARIREFIKG